MHKTKNSISTLLKIYIVFIIAVIYTFNYSSVSAKSSIEATVKPLDYSEEYQKYLNLKPEEKAKVLMPNQYDITSTPVVSGNPIYISHLMGSVLGANSSSTSYDLRDIISKNLVIRDQGELNNCWSFAAVASAESTIALADYKAGNTSNTYNFSEKQLDYAVSGNSTSDKYNVYGVNKDIAAGGVASWAYASMAGGHSLVNESDMPYDNNTSQTTTSVLYGKQIQTELYDTHIFSADGSPATRNEIKDFIVNYGGVFAPLHGADMDTANSFYNPVTNSIYCNNSTTYPADHAVLIIGWNDNYSKNNFLSSQRPSSDGAWIIKNSWGTEYGENGFMYVSYEDANINSENYGIKKMTYGTDYDYIYQYDELFPNQIAQIQLSATAPLFLKNDFTKQSSDDEYLTKVGITVPETQTLQVYVNPTGTNNDRNMKLVTLEEGESKTVEPGFHKLVFAEPIKITGNKFSVVISAIGNNTYNYYTQYKSTESFDIYNSKATVETNKCFMGYGYTPTDVRTWQDLGNYHAAEPSVENCDSTIKAFTKKVASTTPVVTGISIKTNPTKTNYYEGENFSSNGMVIQANYSDNTSRDLANSDLTITNATNLTYGQTSIKVSYNGFTIDVPITVSRNNVTSLTITNNPSKTVYNQGENFDPTGMVISANYANGNVRNLSNSSLTLSNNTSLKAGQTYITVSYGGKSINVPITVKSSGGPTPGNTIEEENEIEENTIPENKIPENNIPENNIPENNIPENTTGEDPIEEKEEPSNTDFSNALINVTKIQNKTYTDSNKKDYSLIGIEVTNIKRPANNDSMDYYIYVSQKASEEDISDWIKVTEAQNDNTKLSFTINTNDFDNINDYKNGSELYIYIKEVAKKGGNQSSKATLGLKTETKGGTKVDYYENDILKESKTVDEIYKETNAKEKEVKADNTTAGGKLPQTGAKMAASIIIGFVVLYGIHSFVEYKRINKKIK